MCALISSHEGVVTFAALHSTGSKEFLDSWKEIAAFLHRGVRTVQRWEKREGLPVHRHQHSKRGTVFAYASEIRQWLASREQPDVSTSVLGQDLAFAAKGR